VIVVGNGQVGKTSMITRFAKGVMTDTYKKTIGTDFMEKKMIMPRTGEEINLMLWDTAGQEMFTKLTKQYYKGAGAVVYVFSTVDRESFLEIERWKAKVESECGEIASVLVQNKMDLVASAAVSSGEVEALAGKMGMKLYRVCVKDNLLIDDVFQYLVESYLARGGEASLDSPAIPSITSVGASSSSSTTTSSAPMEEKKEMSTSPPATSSGSPPSTSSGTSSGSPTPTLAPTTSSASSAPSSTLRPEDNKPFTLSGGPSKTRTGGKKKTWCTIL